MNDDDIIGLVILGLLGAALVLCAGSVVLLDLGIIDYGKH